MVKWIGAVVVIVVAALFGAFFLIGGGQVVRAAIGPDLPAAVVPGTPETDLAFLRSAVLSNERGATEAQMHRFLEIMDEAAAPQSAEDLTLIAARALAAFDNAHTTPIRPLMRRLPVRFHWTSDALVIVKARPEYAALLGRRVVSLGGRTPEELLVAMPQLVGGGTPAWVRYRSAYYYSAPTALAVLGALANDHVVEVRTMDAAGMEETIALSADSEFMRGDPFWDFLDAMPGDTHFDTDGWQTLLRPEQSLPLYQQEPQKLFLVRDVPEQRAVYLRMNGSINDDGETISQFTRRVLEQVTTTAPENIVVDFRHNRGGNYVAVLPLVRGLARSTPRNGRLYLIVGPNTFSAGLLAASQFRRIIPDRLTIVGGEVGDRLRFRGEGFVVRLPATGVEVYLSTAWDDVSEDCGWLDECWPPNKFLLRGVGSLTPDIPADNTWASYASGEDLVIAAVWADVANR